MFQRFTRPYSFIFWIAAIFGLVCLGMFASGAVYAEGGKTAVSPPSASLAPPHVQFDDLACVLCHSDTDGELTFPSGESVSAQIDPDVIAHSVHGTTAEEPLVCVDCHQPANDYKFPHEPIETIDYRGYQLEKAVSCERCHTEPHVDSHKQDDGETAVSCTDCHGSHDVQPSVDVQNCADCHVEAEVEVVETAVLTSIIENGLFAQKADSDYCLSCHSQPDLTMEFANGDLKSVTIDAAHLQNSVHGSDNTWQPLECADCHEIDIFPHTPITATSAREYSLERYTTCERCHEDNYAKEIDSVHGAALAEGTMEAAICTDCHGAHDTPVPDEPRERISQTCGQCHEEENEAYRESVHGEALIGEDNPDVPVCVDCHGVHDTHDPKTAQFRTDSPQLCASCHADEELMAEYDISANVFDTYLADFHGTTLQLFEPDPDTPPRQAVCFDCHGIHDIKRTDDPVHGLAVRENLLDTCQQCHEGAAPDFPDAWLAHYEPDSENVQIVYYTEKFFTALTLIVTIFLILYIGLDFGRLVIKKLKSKE